MAERWASARNGPRYKKYFSLAFGIYTSLNTIYGYLHSLPFLPLPSLPSHALPSFPFHYYETRSLSSSGIYRKKSLLIVHGHLVEQIKSPNILDYLCFSSSSPRNPHTHTHPHKNSTLSKISLQLNDDFPWAPTWCGWNHSRHRGHLPERCAWARNCCPPGWSVPGARRC